MTYNIRYDTEEDGVNVWRNRRERVVATILRQRPDVVGVQEALPGQMRDLAERLQGYDWYGVGREDGKQEGEFAGLFYRANRFHREDAGTFWLSQTPDKPGLGWDAACVRCTSWVRLIDRDSGKTFFYFNTHVDFEGPVAQLESMKLLAGRVPSIAGLAPFLLVGDFNITPDSEPLRFLAAMVDGSGRPLLRDARQVSAMPHAGPRESFIGFQVNGDDTPPLLIDYIFVSQGISVLRHVAVADNDGRYYPSDHVPLVAELTLD
jgi:endonuclease/exonuclease/phosphatase family metal-dependent hydrolase